MKVPRMPFICCGAIAIALCSCGEEEKKLTAQELELAEKVEFKRKQLNDLVKKVDELETLDLSEKLIDAEIELGGIDRKVEFEKSEQANLSEEVKGYEKQLADFKAKYPLGE